MPKKSKKEKILADIRRRVHTEQSITARIPTLVKEEASPVFRFQAKKETPATVRIDTQNRSTELIAIKKDLYKTFILASLAIAAELAIYWFGRGKL